MEEDKIVLDRRSFEALAVDSRVKILKSLKQRRKTLSEISREQGMSVSGTKEHLETLEKVGLIEKRDDGHKWKYYELTKKGSDIVAPRELRVWILLSISMIALVVSMAAVFTPPMAQSPLAAVPDAGNESLAAVPVMATAGSDVAGGADEREAMVTEGVAMEDYSASVPPEPEESADSFGKSAVNGDGEAERGAEGAEPETAGTKPDLGIPLAVAAVSAVTMLGCAAVLLKNRMAGTQ